MTTYTEREVEKGRESEREKEDGDGGGLEGAGGRADEERVTER